MKRAVLVVVLVAMAVAGIDVLADLTQDRPDRVPRGSRSEVVLEVKIRSGLDPAPLGRAQGLWGACEHTVYQRLVEPGLVELEAGRFLAVTEPAIGEHAWRKLQGCLEDFTLDRLVGHVVSKKDVLPA
ncbi:MAG TPA: hypothetical protein VF045_02215 [Acidimicrobiales bacterium]|jgi:hypothetical protein